MSDHFILVKVKVGGRVHNCPSWQFKNMLILGHSICVVKHTTATNIPIPSVGIRLQTVGSRTCIGVYDLMDLLPAKATTGCVLPLQSALAGESDHL